MICVSFLARIMHLVFPPYEEDKCNSEKRRAFKSKGDSLNGFPNQAWKRLCETVARVRKTIFNTYDTYKSWGGGGG